MTMTKWFGLAAWMLALLTCAESARAGIRLDFTGTVSQFFDTVAVPQPVGHAITTDVPNDIVPGVSTFEGTVFLPDTLTLYSVPDKLYHPAPIFTVTIANEFVLTSEVSYPPAILEPAAVTDLGGGSYDFSKEYDVRHVGLFGATAELTAVGQSLTPLNDPIDQRIALDLSAFQSGYFLFAVRDYLNNTGVVLFPNGIGHDIEVMGRVTSLVVITPEPATLVAAGLAGLIGLGLAWRRRKAQLGS